MEHYHDAIRAGRGVLFATAHLGNWELSAFSHALLETPMSVVVRPLDNPLIDRLVERRRTLSGNRLIDKRDNPNAGECANKDFATLSNMLLLTGQHPRLPGS